MNPSLTRRVGIIAGLFHHFIAPDFQVPSFKTEATGQNCKTANRVFVDAEIQKNMGKINKR